MHEDRIKFYHPHRLSVYTHNWSSQTRESTLSTLTWDTYGTALSTNTLGSRDTSRALGKMTQQMFGT